MKQHQVSQIFSVKRTEHQSTTLSVYRKFVVPPAVEQFDLRNLDSSISLEGARGCGKTSYIRYFSHWTQLDVTRQTPSPDALDRPVVLYWKPDTVYFRALEQISPDSQIQNCFFLRLSGLEVFREVLGFISNMAHHFPELGRAVLGSPRFGTVYSKITDTKFESIEGALCWVEDELFEAQCAVKSGKVDGLKPFDPNVLIRYLLKAIVSSHDRLRELKFKLYVDEFENLTETQQQLINGYRKGSDASLTWNVAYKQFANVVNTTPDGGEQLNIPDDCSELLMQHIYDGGKRALTGQERSAIPKERKALIAEILIQKLLNGGLFVGQSFATSEMFFAPDQIDLRATEKYQNDVIAKAKRLLPDTTINDHIRDACCRSGVRKKIIKRLTSNSFMASGEAEDFLNDDPVAAMVTTSLMLQQSFSSGQLKSYREKVEPGYGSYKERLKNYDLSVLVNYNVASENVNIPIYSGFDRFCTLSGGNIRHFLDLCHRSMSELDGEQEVATLEDISLTPVDMNRGATVASGAIANNVVTYEPKGKTLSALVYRLGEIFKVLAKDPAQSEPNKTTFVIRDSFGDLPVDIASILSTAKCWRVLIESENSRVKTQYGQAAKQYQLNPIFAPYFQISYRMGRTLEFDLDSFSVLCQGTGEEYVELQKRYSRKVVASAQFSQNELSL